MNPVTEAAPIPAGTGFEPHAHGLERMDVYPTRTFNGFKLRIGRPFPFGASSVPGGVNFSIFSGHATACTLVLFKRGQSQPFAEIPFPAAFRIGDVFVMIVFDLDYESTEYGYRMEGPYRPELGHRFDPSQILLDPYAKAMSGRNVWGLRKADDVDPHRGQLVFDDFDWGEDQPPQIPVEDLIVYEMHVRGLTRHASSGVKFPGTYAGIRQKIPYLKELGVNCVELMPVFEFDEFDGTRVSPQAGETLLNYWGYSTLGFFAPKAGYAATGKLGMQVDELKSLVKELHRNGIEIILDVVFNHTGEGGADGPTISFRGIDNRTYYMLAPDGSYLNFSGTGNTLNCNHPVVRNFVRDCLRYWAAEYHIDGFRFDLASVLGRDPSGAPLSNPPLLESLAFDPILARCKLIAEAWDAGGLYQVGCFPRYGRWAEWNGKYRDCLRRFLKGDAGQVEEMARRLSGSSDLYGQSGATTSVNFVTCHDGFTLRDLVSYNAKHNEANGEGNRDGCDANFSWNCGWEGPTADPQIEARRRRQMKNAIAMLLLSEGIPMILMGDEMGRTQLGNNNAYCQDNELSWLDWNLLTQNGDLFRFFKQCIAFRKSHSVLASWSAARGDVAEGGVPGVTWHGTRAWNTDWSDSSRTLAFMLAGHAGGSTKGTYIYAALNMYWQALPFELPKLPAGWRWHVFANTSMPPGQDVADIGQEPDVADQGQVLAGGRSVIILVGKDTSPAPAAQQRLTVPAQLSSLGTIEQFVRGAAAAGGLSEQAGYKLCLAVVEIVTNSITHGLGEQAGEAVLDLSWAVGDDAVTVVLEDTGRPYNPSQTPCPTDLTAPLVARKVGGLGISLAMQAVDRFDYQRVGDKNRHTFIMKRLPQNLES
jgi:glycogen operon protein